MTTKTITTADEAGIREWLNCTTASVDAGGDVWVERPMTGHWLNEDRKAEYVDWRDGQ
ncbi:hypothetical protein ABE488_09160 [Luteimonas sp. TWI662]|uniref:hypothetical protein n=1 Tax=Luteimonas sp. TWI662 TaxID=3136789 RepID=UPI00320890E8